MRTGQSTYDFVIIGAGPAGSILASRLAHARPRLTILLIDAGGGVPPDDCLVWDPRQWARVQQQTGYEWGYVSVPQSNLDHRSISMNRARVLGGCSVHNAMVYVQGGRWGFDRWADEGCTGWSYAEVLPHFRSVERDVTLTTAAVDPFTESLFAAAAQTYGLPFNPDYNALPSAWGASPFQFLIDDRGRRETDFEVFVARRQPPNLSVLPYALASGIIFEGTAAAGVRFTDRLTGSPGSAFARQEVILAAGAIGTPQILMLSGIGPGGDLARHGIASIVDLPGVGQNLQDDLYLPLLFTSPRPLPPQPYGLMGAVIFGYTPPSGVPAPVDVPELTNVECSLASGTMLGLDLPPGYQQSYLIYPNVQLLESRGAVRLSSADPADAPLIDPNYLGTPAEMQRCLDALTFARTIGNAPALAPWRSTEIYPGPAVKTPAEAEAYIRARAGTCFHYAGTCRMGADAMSVVNPQLQVHGVSRLRVVDASIIPTTVSGNTAAATMMIADRAASFILAHC